MVKNSHYKEHIMRSISESGGRRRQARDKRKKALPVRKLLELERAQQVLPFPSSYSPLPLYYYFINFFMLLFDYILLFLRNYFVELQFIPQFDGCNRKRVSSSSSNNSSSSSERWHRRRCGASGRRRRRRRRGSRAKSAVIKSKRRVSSSTSGSVSEIEGNWINIMKCNCWL